MDDYTRLIVTFSTSAGHLSSHTIYCKKHTVRQNSDVTPNLRTMFSLGWPPYCSSEDVESVFSRAGGVENVFLSESAGSVDSSSSIRRIQTFCVGYVVFVSEKDLENALKLSSSKEAVTCSLSRVGLLRWTAEYMEERVEARLLEEVAEVGMACYDRQQEEAELARLKKANVPDEDGWITVSRKNPRISVSQ